MAIEADGVLEDAGERQVIRFRRRLAHPVERVWRALTDPADLIGWWGDVEVDLVEGGEFTVTWLNTDQDGKGFTMHEALAGGSTDLVNLPGWPPVHEAYVAKYAG